MHGSGRGWLGSNPDCRVGLSAGKYKPVIFAQQQLDRHKVFWAVQDRGGFQGVCASKKWKVPRLARLPGSGLMHCDIALPDHGGVIGHKLG